MSDNKKTRNIRGVVKVNTETFDMTFKPYNETGEPAQFVIEKMGDSKIYETLGEKKSRTVAHLVAKAGDPDPLVTFYEQLDRMGRSMQTKAKPKLKGRTLMDEENARVTLSKKESRIEMVLGIDLKATPNYNQALMNLMYKVNQCFATNQTSLCNAR